MLNASASTALFAASTSRTRKRPKTVLILQPAFTLVFIHRDDLLRDPVDVFEQGAGDRLDDGVPDRFGDIDRAHLGENDLVHLALTETIGADERVHRDAVLGEPARILQGCGGRFHPLHGDVVAQRVQDGVHVALDAGAEQLHDPRIAAQLGDLVLQQTLNARRELRQPVVQPVGSLGDVAAHVDVTVETPGGHLMTVDRRATDNRRFAALTGCVAGDKTRVGSYRFATVPRIAGFLPLSPIAGPHCKPGAHMNLSALPDQRAAENPLGPRRRR